MFRSSFITSPTQLLVCSRAATTNKFSRGPVSGRSNKRKWMNTRKRRWQDMTNVAMYSYTQLHTYPAKRHTRTKCAQRYYCDSIPVFAGNRSRRNTHRYEDYEVFCPCTRPLTNTRHKTQTEQLRATRADCTRGCTALINQTMTAPQSATVF